MRPIDADKIAEYCTDKSDDRFKSLMFVEFMACIDEMPTLELKPVRHGNMSDVIKNLYILFDAAWEENMNGRGTDITRMVTTFVPDAIQDLQAYECGGK